MKRNSRIQLSRKYKAQIIRDIYSLSSKDVDKLSTNIPVLKKNDKLFVETDNVNNPRIIPNAKDNELYYEYGYINATLMLLNNIEFCKSYLRKDSYIYPALFCFRQYLENMMKIIILKHDKNGITGLGHNLTKCWDRLVSYIDDLDDVVLGIGNIIKELQDVDCHASAFRYTGALNDCYKQFSRFKSNYIDVNELRNRILQTYRFFDGLYELSCRLKE